MRLLLATLALICVVLIQGCVAPSGSSGPAQAGKAAPSPDFGNKAYGY